MRVYRHRQEVLKKATYSSYGTDGYPTLADKIATVRIKRSHPELSSQYKAIRERERKQEKIEQLEKRKRLDKEREANQERRRKERKAAQEKRRSRNRGRGDGGMDF